MPGADWLVSVFAFAVSMSATPGPNNTMVAASGANFGFRRTLPHMLGISVGFSAMLVIVALGANEVLRAYPWLHQALRWAGAGYLLWLAWHIATTPVNEARGSPAARPLTFIQAALFQWVNPKAWVIAAGAVVTYTASEVRTQALLLAAIFLVVTLPSTAFWTGIGVGAARVLRGPRALRAFNVAMAGLLVASLAGMLLEG